MSIDIGEAWALLRARAEAQITGLPMWWAMENSAPDESAPFVFFTIVSEKGDFIERGAGRASNRYRNRARLEAYVFVPIGWGMQAALDVAKPVAAAFRRYAVPYLKFEGADIHPVAEGAELVPPGLSSAAGNCACCVVEAPFYFDQID